MVIADALAVLLIVGGFTYWLVNRERRPKLSTTEQILMLPPSQRKYYDISLRSATLLQGLIRDEETLGAAASIFLHEGDRQEAASIIHDFYQEVDSK